MGGCFSISDEEVLVGLGVACAGVEEASSVTWTADFERDAKGNFMIGDLRESELVVC